MATPTYHNNQWGHTDHLGKFCGSLVTEKLIDRESGDKIYQILTKNEAFGTEKFDGTNVGRCSETGQLYGRRILIEDGAAKYVNTSLKKVIEADVVGFREKLLETSNIQDVSKAGKLIMYGELMCNKKYKYEEKGLVEGWLVFGAVLQDKDEDSNLLNKLLEAGYAARGTFSKEYIQIFLNSKFVETAEKLGITCAPQIGCGKTIKEIVKENKDYMKKGECEGIVITYGSKELGFRSVKWKGAHEEQPGSTEEVKKAIEKFESVDVVEWLEQLDSVKEIFKHLNEVIEETSGNKKCVTKKAKKQNKPDRAADKQNHLKENVLNFAIKSAMTKFDIPEAYAARGEEGRDQYIDMVTGEVVDDINSNKKLPDGELELEEVRKRISSIYVRRTTKKNNVAEKTQVAQ